MSVDWVASLSFQEVRVSVTLREICSTANCCKRMTNFPLFIPCYYISALLCPMHGIQLCVPGPAQLSVACSTEKRERVGFFVRVREEPGNEASCGRSAFAVNTFNSRQPSGFNLNISTSGRVLFHGTPKHLKPGWAWCSCSISESLSLVKVNKLLELPIPAASVELYNQQNGHTWG